MKHGLLEEFGLIINHKYIRRIIHKYGLVCKVRKARFERAKQPHGTIGNILNRYFQSNKPLRWI